MERMGPEAWWVASKMAPRADLAEYARLEHGRAEVRAIEGRVRRELEYLPVKRSAGRRLARWGQRWLRPDEGRVPVSPVVRPRAVEAAVGPVGEARPFGATLAAIPALRAGMRPDREPHYIAAMPLFGRA